MYVPASFHVDDPKTLHAFMERHSFATLISTSNAKPFATHLPLLLDRDIGAHGRLIGHMARPNPQWKSVGGTCILAIFQGPHAYITPTWYESRETVPTWNYTAVHAYGPMTLIDEANRLREIVERTVNVYERSMPQPWSMADATPAYIETMLKGIIGFEIAIDRVEGKWKLNQNHPLERREKVIRGLEATGRPEDAAVAQLMRGQIDSEPQP